MRSALACAVLLAACSAAAAPRAPAPRVATRAPVTQTQREATHDEVAPPRAPRSIVVLPEVEATRRADCGIDVAIPMAPLGPDLVGVAVVLVPHAAYAT